MRAVLMVTVMLAAACGDDDTGWSAPDGGVASIDADHHQPGDITDFFGESCRPDPDSNTVCHGDRGWCVSAICRPMCVQDARRCPGGVEHHTDAGACYCTQQ